MPAKKIKAPAPVKPEGADDIYIVCVGTQSVYFFNGPTFYEWVNQRRSPPGDRREFIFLSEFPLPRPGRYNLDYNDSREEKHSWGSADTGRYFGRYCPFQSTNWPHNGVLVLKNGKIFVPEMREVTRVVNEYCDVTNATAEVVLSTNVASTAVVKKTPARRSRK